MPSGGPLIAAQALDPAGQIVTGAASQIRGYPHDGVIIIDDPGTLRETPGPSSPMAEALVRCYLSTHPAGRRARLSSAS
ncbi:hypothetical protein [Streptosporangium sp. CA-115845]|uniref:hypothetical protein n=1 Tax=Streptosporangium sp. CA-115845 TaxID=3240071 RepID=UPI003D8A2880